MTMGVQRHRDGHQKAYIVLLERRLAIGYEQDACIGVGLADGVGEGSLSLKTGVRVARRKALVG